MERLFGLKRRRLLALAAALTAGGWAGPVLARSQARTLIEQFAGAGAVPQTGALRVDLPELADNANAVPLRIRLDAPVDDQTYCEEVMVVAEKNPRPMTCKFRLSPLMGVVDLGTRIRLAETQHVTVLARMNDGRILQYRQEIIVAAGGCGGI